MRFEKKLAEMAHKALLATAKQNEEGLLDYEKRSITQSNALARAAKKLTLDEKRIVYMAMTEINPVRSDNRLEYRVKAVDFARVFNTSLKNSYAQIKDAADRVFEREWRIVDGKKMVRNRWLSSSEYHQGDGYVELRFTVETMQYLQAISSHFTKYKLTEVSDFKRLYTWQLFELFAEKTGGKQFEGWLKISADDLRFSLDVPPSYSTGMFHKKVLQPAIDELSVKRNLVIKLEYKKTGRKITQYNFVFCENDQQKLQLE